MNEDNLDVESESKNCKIARPILSDTFYIVSVVLVRSEKLNLKHIEV